MAGSKIKTISAALLVVYLCAVGYLYFGNPSSQMDFPIILWGIPFDKVIHFFMMMPLPILIYNSLDDKNRWRRLFFTMLVSVIMATILELIQSKINPLRTTDIWDLVANLTSIAFVSALISFVLSLKRR